MKIIKEPNNGLGIYLHCTKDQWDNKVYTFYCGLWCWHFMSNRTWWLTDLLHSKEFFSKDGIHIKSLYGARYIIRDSYLYNCKTKEKIKF